MSSLNFRPYGQLSRAYGNPSFTHEGAVVPQISDKQKLVRMTLANMLWENQYYVDGKTTAELIAELVKRVDADFVSTLALKAREKFKLRHIPLLLTRELARSARLSASVLAAVIQRPDEMGEFLSIYWKDGRSAISSQVKKGLAKAFTKFGEYQMAKWDKNSANVSVRDVMFLVHPKPVTLEQVDLFKRIANQELKTPDTWETALSAGADKKETFERLMLDKKLGALAFLRNLRNMTEAGIDPAFIRAYGSFVDASKVLPFRYLAAARIVPQFKDMLEHMMFSSLESHDRIPGKTALLVDVSGSMFGYPVSAKSDLDRFDAAAALAVLCREVCEKVDTYSFSNALVKVTGNKRGFDLVDSIRDSQSHAGTYLGSSLDKLSAEYDRVIVFTDEQSHDVVGAPKNGAKGYIINVAAYQNGVNHDAWTTVSGFSEAVIDYIQALESADSLF